MLSYLQPHPIAMDTALRKKLRLDKHGIVACIRNLGEATPFDEEGWDAELVRPHYDLIIAYVANLEAMVSMVHQIHQGRYLPSGGCLYLAYPKKGNSKGLPAIGRDDIFPALGVDDSGYPEGTELKFNLMVSLDDSYTIIGLKAVPRSTRPKKRPSMCTSDYAHHISDLEAHLRAYPSEYRFFQGLAPGYRRAWATYVYSASRPTTIDRRLEELVETLALGFKSRDHRRAEEARQQTNTK